MKNKLVLFLFANLILSACSKKKSDYFIDRANHTPACAQIKGDSSAIDSIFIKRLKDGPKPTNVWVQGKMCADKLGRLYIGYTSATGHHAKDRTTYTSYSDDNGVTWSALKVIKPNPNSGKNYGVVCQALGVDDTRKLWAIVRNLGNNFLIGHTFHELWTSTDFGATWTFICRIDEITSGPDIIGGFHDMIQVGNKMITGYHSDKGSKLGFMSIDMANPTIRTHTDIIADGGPHDFAEATLCYDSVNKKIIGGLRSQLTAPQLFYMNPDFTGFERFPSACKILKTPLPVKIMDDKVVYMGIERNQTGEMVIFVNNLADFYAKTNINTCKATIGYIIDNPILGTSNTGVPDMEILNGLVHFGFSQQRNDGNSSVYYGKCNPFNFKKMLTYSDLVNLRP